MIKSFVSVWINFIEAKSMKKKTKLIALAIAIIILVLPLALFKIIDLQNAKVQLPLLAVLFGLLV